MSNIIDLFFNEDKIFSKENLYKFRKKINYSIDNPTEYFDNWFLGNNKENYYSQVIDSKYIANDEIFDLFYPYTKFYPNKDILDIGSGSGLTGKKFIEKGLKLYGADITKNSNQLALDLGYEKIFYFDLNNIKKSEKFKKFDLIISAGVIGDFVDPKIGIKNLLNKLNLGGIAGFSIEETLIGKNNFELLNNYKKRKKIDIIKSYSKETYDWSSVKVNYDYFLIQKIK